MPNALAKLDRARAMLAEARTLDAVKKIRDMAEAARVYAKAAHLGRDAEYRAAEISLLAQHKAGMLLKQLPRAKPKGRGGREKESEYWKAVNGSGTSYRTAERWQAVAKKDESVLEKYFAWARKKDRDISTAGFLRAVKPQRPKRKSPYTRHISVPLTENEYDAVRKWTRFSFYENEHLKAEQRFLREALAQFFQVTGLNLFEEKSEIATRLLKWLAQQPVSESPLFKEMMKGAGMTGAELQEERQRQQTERERKQEDHWRDPAA